MKLSSLILTCLFFLSSCASYQKGEYARVLEGEHPKNLPISVEYDDTYSTRYFNFLTVTFGNYNPDWVRIKKVEVTSIPGLEDFRITAGPDLSFWGEAIKHKIAVDNHNRQLFVNTLVGVSAAAAYTGAQSGNDGLATGGLLALGATAGIEGFNSYMNKLDSLERAKILPPDHLYAPFSVPPGLHLKRWLLVETQQKQSFCEILFNVTYEDEKVVKYRVAINSSSCN